MTSIVNLLMAFVYLRFVLAHYEIFRVVHSYSVGLVVAQESLLCALFLLRKPAKTLSTRADDWGAAAAGTFLPLMLNPTGVSPTATVMQMVAIAMSIASLLSLRRAFGIVAAHRETVTSGMYKFVRHPQYAAHHLLLLGYLFASPTPWNFAIVAITIGALWMRIIGEEALLKDASTAYREYCVETPYRILPGVI